MGKRDAENEYRMMGHTPLPLPAEGLSALVEKRLVLAEVVIALV